MAAIGDRVMGWLRADAMPVESWWLDGAAFYARARAEQLRMRASRYGQTDILMTGIDVIPEKPRKTARAKEIS